MATERGMEDSLIKILSRWESTAYQHYVKIPRECLMIVSRECLMIVSKMMALE